MHKVGGAERGGEAGSSLSGGTDAGLEPEPGDRDLSLT